jgi:dolichol kinase
MINSYKRRMEFARQLVHMCFGLVILAIIFFLPFSRQNTVAIANLFVLGCLLYILVIMDRRSRNMHSPFADYLLDSLERAGVEPAHGAFWYAIGALFALSFIPTPEKAVSAIMMLAIADGLSTIVGSYGKHPLPYNCKKSIEGTLAFFASGLLTYFLIGPVALPLALFAAAVESLDLPIDDNLSVPVACALFFKLLTA